MTYAPSQRVSNKMETMQRTEARLQERMQKTF